MYSAVTIILSEVSHSEKDKYHMISLIWAIKKMVQVNLFTNRNRLTDLESELLVSRGEDRGKDRMRSWDWHIHTAAATAKSLQSCPTLCDPIDGSPPGSSVPGILQARTLEWVAISFSNAWKWKVKVKSLSHVWLLVTPWTAAYQAPLSMGFSRQEYWSGLPLPSHTLLYINRWPARTYCVA